MCLHTLLFFTFPPSWKEGGQGDGAVPHYGACKRGVQRGAPLWQVVWRMCLHKLLFFTFPLPGSGESRGVHPHWQAVWRMCLHKLHFFTFPPSFQEGGQRDGAVPHYGACKRGVQRGAPLWQVVWRMCLHKLLFFTFPLPGSGESRGVHPHWQAVWRMCLHKLHFFTCPLPSRKGARGMVRSRTTVRASGESRGEHPSGRLHGIPRYNEGGVTCLRPPTFQEHKELFL